MEQYAFKDTTLRIFREILDEPEYRDWPDVGIAIQAYLTDTEQDLRDLLDWAKARGTPVWVRLVKGAYWDYETVIAAQNDWPVPVWTREVAVGRVLRALLAAAARELRVAAAGVRQPQRPQHVRGAGAGRRARRAADRVRVPDALRHGRRVQGRARRPRPAGADLHALRPTAAGHGVPRPPAAREHVERIVPAGDPVGRHSRGGAVDEPGPAISGQRPAVSRQRRPHAPFSAEPKATRFHNEPPSDFAREDVRQQDAGGPRSRERRVRQDLPAGHQRRVDHDAGDGRRR